MYDAVCWLITPVVNWWTFIGTIPALVYLAFFLFTVLAAVQVIRLFLGK